MIKQPLLPLKVYNGLNEWQYENFKAHSGDKTLVRSHYTFLPPFQILFDNRHTDLPDIIQFDVVNYIDGTVTDILAAAKAVTGMLEVVTHGDYQNIIFNGRDYPLATILNTAVGLYYMIISDGTEIWYTEVFDLCNYQESIIMSGAWTESGWQNVIGETRVASVQILIYAQLCKSVAAGWDYVESPSFPVVYDEALDLYVLGGDAAGPACGAITGWDDDMIAVLVEAGTIVDVSERIDIIEGYNHGVLTPTKTCNARLRLYVADGDQTNASLNIRLYRQWIEDNVVIKWYHPKNFCDIVYTEGYENYLILNTGQIMADPQILEDAAEDDENNKYRLIGTNQKWNAIEIAAAEHMFDAFSIIPLHDMVELILPTGEVVTIVESALEHSLIDDYLVTLRLLYREASCSVDNCGFNLCCCPTLDNVLDYEAGGVAALPAQPCCSGDRYLVLQGGFINIYESDGAAWNIQADEAEVNACVYSEDEDDSATYYNYWYWDVATTSFAVLCQLTGVTDNADGTATLDGTGAEEDEFDCVIYVQAEYDAGAGFVEIGTPVTLEVFDATGITVTTGAGNFDFRVRYYSPDCPLSRHGDVNETITV